LSGAESAAPLFTKTYDLVLWLSGRRASFPKSQRFALAARIMEQGYVALEAVTLALKGFDRPDNVERADAAFALLRVYLRLAADQKLLRARQLTFVVGRLEELGRMVGGWRKKL
jgi:hypothetical protein